MGEVLRIGTRREVFWDDYLLDKTMTDAAHRLIPPQKMERAFVFDKELYSVSYPNIVRVAKGYRMYYLSFVPGKGKVQLRVLCSVDGVNWYRPDVGYGDNVVIDALEDSSLCVFYDPNPDCPKNQRYKALTLRFTDRAKDIRALWCYPSADGYYFEQPYPLAVKGRFDTLNATFYKDGLYHCYLRDLHWLPDGGFFREVRHSSSPDFVHWSESVPLTYDDGFEFHMYTNNIMPYPGAEHLLIGLPTRYVEHERWTPNDGQFASHAVKRKAGAEIEPRCAVAMTDLLFICSRDGVNFHRYPQAYLTPGEETPDNWIYGDCFASYPLIELEDGYSFFLCEKEATSPAPKEMVRYRIRKDGFACIEAQGEFREAITKPMYMGGKELHINFSTSAYGQILVDLMDEDGIPIRGTGCFAVVGDSTDRQVVFQNGRDFSFYADRPVRLRFRMFDAKLFAMWFEK